MSSENKLVKTVTDSAVLIGLAAGVGYVAKKADERIIYELIHPQVLQIMQNGSLYYRVVCT